MRVESVRIELVPLKAQHWDQVCQVYADGIATGQATFETKPPSWEDWDRNHLPFGRLVAVSQQSSAEVLGWAALSRVSTRKVYSGVAEHSVYVAQNARRRGIGKALIEGVIKESEANGIWTLQTSIFPENIASISLHKTCGFREVGTRERIAQLHGVWRNTVLLERRSKLTGSSDSVH